MDHFHIVAKEQSNQGRQVIVSNEQGFFEDFEETHAATLSSQTVTYGNEWDLYSASMTETSARVKRAVEKLRPSELLAAMVGLKDPAFMRNHTAARDRAFRGLGLYWEHNWTADGPVSRSARAAWQEEVVSDIENYVNLLQAEALIRFGDLISCPDHSNRFFVLNPLGWSRTDAANFAYSGPTNIHVRDLTTGQNEPHQMVNLGGEGHLRILASDVRHWVFSFALDEPSVRTEEAGAVSHLEPVLHIPVAKRRTQNHRHLGCPQQILFLAGPNRARSLPSLGVHCKVLTVDQGKGEQGAR